MQTYDLDLSVYEVDKNTIEKVDGKNKVVTVKETFKVRDELSGMLRLPGVYKDGTESFDGLTLAKQIRECDGDSLTINDDDLVLIRKVLDQLIAAKHDPAQGKMSLGGPRYSEFILRIFGLGK